MSEARVKRSWRLNLPPEPEEEESPSAADDASGDEALPHPQGEHKEPGKEEKDSQSASASEKEPAGGLQSGEGKPKSSGQGKSADGEKPSAPPDREKVSSDRSDSGETDEEETEDGETGEGKNAVNAFTLETQERRKRLAYTFATIMAHLAEEPIGTAIYGDEKYSMKLLMMRHITRRPLSQCKESRQRVGCILVVDSSPSCKHMADVYPIIAGIAAQSNDVELYDAPNAEIQRKWSAHHKQWVPCKVPTFVSRRIIFCGDFDGAKIIHGWAESRNLVFWFSCAKEEITKPDDPRRKIRDDFIAVGGTYLWPSITEEDLVSLAKQIR